MRIASGHRREAVQHVVLDLADVELGFIIIIPPDSPPAPVAELVVGCGDRSQVIPQKDAVGVVVPPVELPPYHRIVISE